jgi:3-deoxy-7-phosphoheptulonate synthase
MMNAKTTSRLEDVRIVQINPLIPPAILQEEIPLTEELVDHVAKGREQVANIVEGKDDRLLVVVGPCSIHDYKSALDYAARLKKVADRFQQYLCVVMRVYFEKPRTTVGWKGFINDPFLNNTYAINKGLRLSRSLLLEINKLGLHAGCELLDTITPQFLGDLYSWAAIGARTTESQVHRELASGMSMSVGFKNGTDGSVTIAIEALKAASHPHSFLSVTKQGLSAIVSTTGNTSCHIILRGSKTGPNYEEKYVKEAASQLKKAGFGDSLMVDCSHGNSQKLHENQILVAKDLAHQISSGSHHVMGVMIESNIVEGRQDIPVDGPEKLKYGCSITDACINFEDTVDVLQVLADAVRIRREKMSSGNHQ